MDEAQLRRELDETYRKFEAADRAGDVESAKQFKQYGTQIENRLRNLSKAQKSGAGPALSAPNPSPEDQEAAAPALEQYAKANDDLDRMDEVTWDDHWKSLKGSVVGVVADRFSNWAADHRIQQADKMEQLRAMKDGQGVLDPGLDPEYQAKMDRLEAEVAAGREQVDPTFYGTFIKPFFSKDGKEPYQRIRQVQEELLNSRSDAAQKVAHKPFFFDEPNPEARAAELQAQGYSPEQIEQAVSEETEQYQKYAKQLNISDPGTWFQGTAMPWEDMDAFLLGMSQNSAQLTAGIVAARLGARGGAVAKARQLRGQGIVNPQVVRAASAKAGTAAGTIAASATDYVMVNDHIAASTREALEATWGDEERWRENPQYTSLIDAGFSPEYAKQVVTDEIAGTTGKAAGVTSMILGAPMNKFWAKLGLEGSVSRMGAAGKGALMEAGQEGIQETSEQVWQNIAESKINPEKPLLSGIGNAFFSGVALGGPIGGAGGVLSGGDNQASLNKDQKALNKGGFREWRETGNERARLSAKVRDPEYFETTPPEQRVSDFQRLEDLQYKEAKAFQRAEKKIIQMQKKYGADPAQRKRVEQFSKMAGETVHRIESDRKVRAGAEERLATDRQKQEEIDNMVRQVEQDNLRLVDLEEMQSDLDTIAGSGLLADPEANERLVEMGYARWRNKAKEEIALTASGRVARESMPQAIKDVRSKIEAGYAGEDRRQDPTRRAKIEAMPDYQRDKELRTHELTRIPNKRAFEEQEADDKAPVVAAVDVDSLKWINDNFGKPSGNQLLKSVADELRKTGLDVYHLSGDEFAVRGASEEEIERQLQVASDKLSKVAITEPSGERSAPPRITWGFGESYDEADIGATTRKKERERKGMRAARGKSPIGLKVSADIQPELPLMSLDTDESIDSIAQQIRDIRGKTDEFSVRRRSKLRAKLRAARADVRLQRAAEQITETLDVGPSDTALTERWVSLPEMVKAEYDLRGAEFYSHIMGEHVSGKDVYLFEHGGNAAMWKNLPSKFRDQNGNDAALLQSQMGKRIARLLRDDSISPAVQRDLENDVRKLKEMGMENASPVHAMVQRVHDYLAGEYNMGGPTPFSDAIDVYHATKETYRDGLMPKMMLDLDPVGGPGYYRDLKKGDEAEVIIDGQGVKARVDSVDNSTVVLSWSNDKGKLLDPDTRESGNSARFSKETGWQVSARYARGGTSYAKQSASWPGQARLGRRWNQGMDTWATMPEARNAAIKKRGGARTPAFSSLRNGGKATKRELRRARAVAGELFAGYRNIPDIQIANTIGDLPIHMQKMLAQHGATGVGVLGMFDEQNPKNGVWVVAGNISAKAKREKVPFDELVAEAVIHETIGHYGVRGFMGGDKQMAVWMDALVRSFPKEAMDKGREYGLIAYDPETGKTRWRSQEARLLAGEELLAEISQYAITEREGYNLDPQQKTLLQSIIDYIKEWMINHNLGRLVRLSERDIYQMLWNAQNFARNGKGFEYRVRTGENLVPWMRDYDIFQAAIVSEFIHGERPTNKDERKQMKQRGEEPLQSVPIFSNNMNRGQHIAALKKLVSDGKVKQDEVEYTGIMEVLEDMTWKDWLTNSGTQTMPDPVRNQLEPLLELANFNAAQWYDKINRMDNQWRKAEKLRGTLPGMDETADTLKKKLNEFSERKPTVEEQNAANMEVEELLAGRVGKKVKIPREIIGNYLNNHALKVNMAHIHGERDSVENMDVTPENWRELDPKANRYDEYFPFVGRYKDYGVYTFHQDMPTGSMSAGHAGDWRLPRRGDNLFMHFRYAAGVEMADGSPAYYIGEIQSSDLFQEREGGPASAAEKMMLSSLAKQNERRLNAAARTFMPEIENAIRGSIRKQYDEYIASIEFQNLPENDQVMRREKYYEYMGRARRDFNDRMTRAMDQEIATLEETAPSRADDARLFDHLDKVAQADVSRKIGYMLTEMFDYAHYYDPDGMIGIPENDAMVFDDRIKTAQNRLTEALVGDSGSGVRTRRLLATDRMRAAMDNAMTHLDGWEPFTDEHWARLDKGAKLASVGYGLILPAEVGETARELFGTRAGDEGRATAIAHALQESAAIVESRGWNVNNITVRPAGGDFEVTAFGASPQPDPLHEVVKAAIADSVKNRMDQSWEHTEDIRIAKVRQKLNEITDRSGAEPRDEDEALEEIDWDGNDSYDANFETLDRDSYAEWKTETWFDGKDSLDLVDEFESDIGWSEYEYNGHQGLDRDHPEYRERISVDDDGDANTEEAEDWLTETRREEAVEYYGHGGPGWDNMVEHFENEWDNNPDLQETEVLTFRIPTEWDENGEMTDWISGAAVKNEMDSDASSWSDPINTNYQIYRGSYYVDYEYDEDDAQKRAFRIIFEYHADNDITPPPSSQFYIPPADSNVERQLRREMERREKPDAEKVKEEIEGLDIKQAKTDAEAQSWTKLWEDAVMFDRKSRIEVAPETPVFKHWQSIGLKFAIADAIRKGRDYVIWEGGGATQSRGGHQPEWEAHRYVDYEQVTVPLRGEDTELIKITTPQGAVTLYEPTMARMGVSIGVDAAQEIMNRIQGRSEPGTSRSEEVYEELRQRFRLIPTSSAYVIHDALNGPLSSHSTALTAETARAELIKQAAEAAFSNESVDGSNPRKGRLLANDIGGTINILKTQTVSPTEYRDTILSSSRMKGARTNYDIKLVSQMNKIVKRFGGKVEEGEAKIDLGVVKQAQREEGARVTEPSLDLDGHPNVRVERLTVPGEGVSWIIMSDSGLVTNDKWEYVDDAERAMERMADDQNIDRNRTTAKVYSVRITDEMREAFGKGSIPIMSRDGDSDGGLPLLARDPIKGNPTLEKLATRVGSIPRKLTLGQRWDKFRKDLGARLNQSIFDRYYGIKYAMDRANWQGPVEVDPYITARLTTSLDTQMEAIMKYGYPEWRDGMVVTGGKKGLLDILAPVASPEMLRAWSLYMVAKRSQRLAEEGRENLIPDNEIWEGIQLGFDYPIFQKVAEEYAAFNEKVLDFAQEAGIIDPETRPMWEHADYVPFYRVRDDRLTGALSPNIGVAGQRNPIKRLRGGEDPIGDIPANIMQNVTNLVDASTKNMAAKFAMDALQGTGIVTKTSNVTFEQGMVPMAQVKQRLVASGMNPDQIPADALEGLQKMMVAKPASGEGVITIMRDGKRETYQTTDRLLYEAMTQINRKQFGRWISFFRGPKRFLTAAVTLDPGFMMANYIRDLGSSFVQSRDIGPLKFAHHFGRSLQGLKQAAAKDDSFRTMMSAGAAFSSGYMNYGDPNSVHRAIRRAQRSKGFKTTLLDTPSRIFNFYKEFGAAFENSNRVAVYNEALAAGRSKKQAAFEAKDLMDFSMGGSNGVVQFLIQTVPFMGARLQGLHRLGRGFADDPAGFAMKGMMIGMAGLALWFRFHDDERYKELEEWDKDTYYHFWVGNRHFRIPKPFEVGAIFNTIPERAFEYAYNDANDAEKLLMQRFGHMLLETFAFNPIPQVAGPAIESSFNHNFFTGRSIVSPYTARREPAEQFRPGTSPSLIEIARLLPEGLDRISTKYRSPQHLENLYRGYTGTLGRYFIMAADESVRRWTDWPSRPTMQPADWPVVGRFYRGTDDMPRRTKFEEEFYEVLRRTEAVKGSMSWLEKIGDKERRRYIKDERKPYVKIAPQLEDAREQISELNADMQKTWMNEKLDPDEKRERIDRLQGRKNRIYQKIWERRPGASEEVPEIEEADIRYLFDEFGVDEAITKIEERAPATAELLDQFKRAGVAGQ